jgi:glutamate carboxypeptidase
MVSRESTIPAPILALPGRTRELGALLERWCAIPSGSGYGPGLARMLEELHRVFASAFPAAVIDEPAADAPGVNPPGVRCLRVRLRPAAPRQVFLCGHYDTVFDETSAFREGRWLDERTLNAPGAADMKGGLVTILAALDAFEASGPSGDLGWEVLITPDEETGSFGSVGLLRGAAERHGFGFVFEPARPNGDIVHSRKGTGNFVATGHGRAAHAGKEGHDGVNAIVGLSRFLLEAAKLPGELSGVLLNVGHIRGGGAVNIVPAFAEALLDIRVTRMVERGQVMDRLQALAAAASAPDGFRIQLGGAWNRPPKECLPPEPAVYEAWRRAADRLGVAPFTWVHAGGASDGNFLCEGGLPSLDGLGPLGEGLHSDREICRVDTIAPRAQIAALVLREIAAGAVPGLETPARRSGR